MERFETVELKRCFHTSEQWDQYLRLCEKAYTLRRCAIDGSYQYNFCDAVNDPATVRLGIESFSKESVWYLSALRCLIVGTSNLIELVYQPQDTGDDPNEYQLVVCIEFRDGIQRDWTYTSATLLSLLEEARKLRASFHFVNGIITYFRCPAKRDRSSPVREKRKAEDDAEEEERDRKSIRQDEREEGEAEEDSDAESVSTVR